MITWFALLTFGVGLLVGLTLGVAFGSTVGYWDGVERTLRACRRDERMAAYKTESGREYRN